MQYADVNGVKSEAQPEVRALGRVCGGEVVAK